jgi:fibronectin type 3 domain-containing protein
MYAINLLLCTLSLITTGCASVVNNDTDPGKEVSVGPGDVKLTWTPPKAYVDGRPLDRLAGYKIRYGTEPGDHPKIILVTDHSTSQYVIKNLSPNTYYFVITAYDTKGIESAPSNETTKVIK